MCRPASAAKRHITLKTCCYTSRLVFSFCFEDTDISQGSIVTHLMCSEIFSNNIITNFLLILTVKTVWKLDNIWCSYKA